MRADGALAEPGQRLVARVVDILVVGVPVALVLRSEPLGLSRTDADTLTAPALAGLLLVYEWVQLAVWGRTLGKRFAGVEVVAEPPTERAGLGPWRALLRTLVFTVPVALRPVPVLGVVAGLFWVANAAFLYEGARRQALHDRLAGTVVARRPAAGPAADPDA